MIPNEEAINELIRHKTEVQHDFGWNITLQTALDMAIEALKAQPCDRLKLDGMLEDAYEHGYQQARYDYESQSCEDVISRDAAIATADFTDCPNVSLEICKQITDEVVKRLKALPPVTPKLKTGKWIKGDATGISQFYTCSECSRRVELFDGNNLLDEFPYCHCGAKMEGESK